VEESGVRGAQGAGGAGGVRGTPGGFPGESSAPGDSPPVDQARRVARCAGTDVFVWQGDITAAGTEAVVNAANNQGWLGSGVAGAIRRAAGDQVEDEAVAQAPWPVGEAVRTGPGRLGDRGVRAILHAAAMAPGRPASAAAVGSATAAALRLAAAEGLASVALPALGTGVGGVALEDAAAAMGAAVRDHADGPTPVTTIVFALYDQEAVERFGGALERELGGDHGR
jgi:O-acetyl-ADP-ribose deacetylase